MHLEFFPCFLDKYDHNKEIRYETFWKVLLRFPTLYLFLLGVLLKIEKKRKFYHFRGNSLRRVHVYIRHLEKMSHHFLNQKMGVSTPPGLFKQKRPKKGPKKFQREGGRVSITALASLVRKDDPRKHFSLRRKKNPRWYPLLMYFPNTNFLNFLFAKKCWIL